jgi:hypothetical protein
VTAPLQYGAQSAGDPTAVMGRRTLAWIADLLLYGAVITAGIASMVEYVEIPSGIATEDACAELERQTGQLANGCFAVDERLYLLDQSESLVQTGLSFGWFAFFVILQGLTGGSPGKLLFGLRVVDQYGAKIGIGKSLGRTLMWFIDAAPWIIPLVGPITAFTSTGHRRVGDLAAGTYVVSSSSVGQPVMPGNAPIPTGQPAWGTGPPTAPPPVGQGWQSPPAAPPPSTGHGWQTGAESGRWQSPAADATPDLDFGAAHVPTSGERADEAPPTVEADPDWSRTPDLDVTPPPAVQDIEGRADGQDGAGPEWAAPTLPEVQDPSDDWQPPTSPGEGITNEPPGQPPAAEPPPFAAPGAEGPPTAGPQSTAPEPPAAAPRYELPPPQWDPARGTYLQWEPNKQAWLQWDATAERWKPIDT